MPAISAPEPAGTAARGGACPACDGMEGRKRATRPDVPLIDLMMPRKDGVQATRETLERDRNARVIVVSSSVAQAEVDRDSSGAEQAERACGRGQGRILCGKGKAQALR